MEELLKEAKKIVSVEVDLEISELEHLAVDNSIELAWMFPDEICDSGKNK